MNFDTPGALLTIELDADNLTLNFHAKNGLTPEQTEILDEFFDKLEKFFEQFRDNLEAQGIQLEGLSLERSPNHLLIKIPDPKLFAQFVQQLSKQSMLPMTNLKPEEAYKPSVMTPFSTTPKPPGF